MGPRGQPPDSLQVELLPRPRSNEHHSRACDARTGTSSGEIPERVLQTAGRPRHLRREPHALRPRNSRREPPKGIWPQRSRGDYASSGRLPSPELAAPISVGAQTGVACRSGQSASISRASPQPILPSARIRGAVFWVHGDTLQGGRLRQACCRMRGEQAERSRLRG